jgi:hypothetical protein
MIQKRREKMMMTKSKESKIPALPGGVLQ